VNFARNTNNSRLFAVILFSFLTLVGSGSVAVGDFRLTDTVANHLDDVVKRGPFKGKRARPFLNSPHTIREIMAGGKGVPDPGGFTGAPRWDVPGTFRGSSGTWQLASKGAAEFSILLAGGLKASGSQSASANLLQPAQLGAAIGTDARNTLAALKAIGPKTRAAWFKLVDKIRDDVVEFVAPKSVGKSSRSLGQIRSMVESGKLNISDEAMSLLSRLRQPAVKANVSSNSKGFVEVASDWMDLKVMSEL